MSERLCLHVRVCVCEDGAQHSDAGLKEKDVEIFMIFLMNRKRTGLSE